MVQKKKQIDDLINGFLGMQSKIPLFQKKEEKSYLFALDDLIVVPEVLCDELFQYRDLHVSYLTLCKGSKLRHRKYEDRYEIMYPVIDNEESPLTQKYMIEGFKLRAFFFCNMYTLRADYSLYRQMVDSKINVSVEVLHSRQDFDDGQLKILTDVILALDDMISNEGNLDKKILVVGSSSERGVASGFSYGAIPLMLVNSEVDLYDPCNNSGSVLSNTVVMNYYREKKDLSIEDSVRYDLLLDDAWEEKMTRSWDVSSSFVKFRNYSVKWFHDYPEMPSLPYASNKYYQVFKTEACEFRAVSRQTSYLSYRSIPLLGDCPGCRELKFRLRGVYSDDLYRFYMSCHRQNCIDKSIIRTVLGKAIGSRKQDYVWYSLRKSSQFLGYSVMYYDKWCDKFPVIPVNQVFYGDYIAFSDFQYVTQQLYEKCFLIVFHSGNVYSNVNSLNFLEYDGQQRTVSPKLYVQQKVKYERKGYTLLRFLVRVKGVPRMKVQNMPCTFHPSCMALYCFSSITGVIDSIERCSMDYNSRRDMVISVFSEILSKYYYANGNVYRYLENNLGLRDKFLAESSNMDNSYLQKIINITLRDYF